MCNPDIFSTYPQNLIYLDNLTRGLQHQASLDAQNVHNKAGSIIRASLHEMARAAIETYERDVETICEFLEIDPNKVAITPNPDLTWNIFLRSYCEEFHPKQIFVSIYDHHAILAPVVGLQTIYNYEIHWLNGTNEIEKIADLAQPNSLVMIYHASPIMGTTRDLAKYSTVIHVSNGYLAVDASLTVSQGKVDFVDLDFAVVDGSIDLLGPLGATIFYSKINLKSGFFGSGLIEDISQNSIKLVSSIERFEVGSPNITALRGLAKSVSILKYLGRNRLSSHREQLHSAILRHVDEKGMIGVFQLINYNRKASQSHTFTFGVPKDVSSHDAALMLDSIHGIAVRSGKACSYLALDTLGFDEVLQISTHIYNTIEEMNIFTSKLKELSAMY